MYLICLLFTLNVLIDLSSAIEMNETSLVLNDRVELLKQKIAQQIIKKLNQTEVYEPQMQPVDENIDYEDHEDDPITPISEKDPRKQQGKFKLKEMKTTKVYKDSISERSDNTNKAIERIYPIMKKRKTDKMIKKSKAADVFYRRMSENDWKSMEKWTHCQDLITPFLIGHKTNMSHSRRLTLDDHVVVRFLQLLAEDIAHHTKDDIHSILYQISNLHLRLFQWDTQAIKLLLNVINKDDTKKHSFKTIKYGLKRIFEQWHLTLGSDPSILLKETRIFRPPCIKINDREGSTKTSKVVRYTKSIQTKLPCKESDYDCED